VTNRFNDRLMDLVRGTAYDPENETYQT